MTKPLCAELCAGLSAIVGMCAGLSAIVGSDSEVEVIGEANNGEEAVAYINDQAGIDMPDLVLINLQMLVMNGVQATRRLKREYPLLPVLVLTTYAADEWVFKDPLDAVRAGTAGYLLKDQKGPTSKMFASRASFVADSKR